MTKPAEEPRNNQDVADRLKDLGGKVLKHWDGYTAVFLLGTIQHPRKLPPTWKVGVQVVVQRPDDYPSGQEWTVEVVTNLDEDDKEGPLSLDTEELAEVMILLQKANLFLLRSSYIPLR